MNISSLIERVRQGVPVAAALTQSIEEASIGQLRKQKPWFEEMIRHLRRERVADKYIPWIVSVFEKREPRVIDGLKKYEPSEKDKDTPEEHWAWMWDFMFTATDYERNRDRRQNNSQKNAPSLLGTLVSLAYRFEEADKKRKWDKALKLGLLKNKRVKDIMFWAKPNVDIKLDAGTDDTIVKLGYVLDRLERLRSRRDIKVQDAVLVHEDDRFTVYSPKTHEASCQLGAATRWCIASDSPHYWSEYTYAGQVFAFIMDAAAQEDDMYKVAVAIPRSRSFEDWSYWDAADHQLDEDDVARAYGLSEWMKLRRKIKDYADTVGPPDVKRRPGDFWAGDEVELNMDARELRIAQDTYYWFESIRFNYVSEEVLKNTKLRRVTEEMTWEIEEGARGTVTSPVHSNVEDSDNYEVYVEGTWGECSADIEEILDEYFPLPPKPKHPLKDVNKDQPLLPGMEPSIIDAYTDALSQWTTNFEKPRKEFKRKVLLPIKAAAEGEWSESVTMDELRIVQYIDPAESIARYGDE